jgi:dolichyldiphosphatase
MLILNSVVEMNGKGYGMPSSHAQFVTFFSVSLTLFLLVRHQPIPSSTHTPTTFGQRLLLSALSLVSAGAVAQSRIYLNYHTPKQVLVGVSAGGVFAVLWFIFVAYLRWAGWVEWGLNTDIARFFRFRDLVLTEDLTDAGWARWENRRAKRSSNGKKRG